MSHALEPFFKPASIAVIGASRRPGTIGYQIVSNLLGHGYRGVVYPVNPNARAVHSIPAYPSVSDIPGPVDLAIVVVPKELVFEVVEGCGRKGVEALVVITAGFKEVGGAGVDQEKRLVDLVRAHGMRLVGPNCMGVLNTDPEWSMNATFAPTMPPPGATGFLSQSGALGVTILDYAADLGIGVHQFVSVGNAADVRSNELLEYWEHDPAIRVILMYIESFGDPRRFTRTARRVARKKPIVVVKSGRTRAGRRAARSHTGALVSGDLAVDSLLGQCGILRANSVQELFDFAAAFEELPIPTGNRVAIVTNAGGPGIIIADACEGAGLDVVTLSDATRLLLTEALPEEASVGNPVDMIASADASSYRKVLEAVLADEQVDAAIAAFVPPLGVRQADVAESIREAAATSAHKPVLAVLMGRHGLQEGRVQLHEAGIPVYGFPESATQALGALVKYGAWLTRPVEESRRFDVDEACVSELLDRVDAEGRSSLTEPEALRVLAAYGIPAVEHLVAGDAEEAARAAEAIGYPVVAKAVSSDIAHKTDVGAVRVDLRTPEEVREAVREIDRNVADRAPEATLEGVLIARLARGGRETILGMATDPSLGPILIFGLGGIQAEALRDVTFGVHPVNAHDAREMVTSIRGSALLEEIRGEGPADVEALIEVLERISQLVEDHPRISEIDVNPCLAFADGALAVDAHITLRTEPAAPREPMRAAP